MRNVTVKYVQRLTWRNVLPDLHALATLTEYVPIEIMTPTQRTEIWSRPNVAVSSTRMLSRSSLKSKAKQANRLVSTAMLDMMSSARSLVCVEGSSRPHRRSSGSSASHNDRGVMSPSASGASDTGS